MTNALFSNTISAVSDLGTSIFTGKAGGHNVLYNMALADTAGPTQGFAPLFGKALKGPWAASPVDVLWAKLGEYGVGIGEANLAFSFITYTISFAGCGVGAIQ